MQNTSSILMIRPVNFNYNLETAETNAFQRQEAEITAKVAQENAVKEFDQLVTLLEDNGIEVIVIKDTPKPYTPDSIFPNNWISFHDKGRVVLYPMMAISRRSERREDILLRLEKRYKFIKKSTVDLTNYERNEKYLEGTGSMVLDRANKIIYACLSPRTDEDVLNKFSRLLGYEVVSFIANDENEKAIYHTNVMMCVGDKFAVVCKDSITDTNQAKKVIQSLMATNHEVIFITFDQMNHFAGNMLEVINQKGNANYLIMSSQAHESLDKAQIKALEKYAKILHSPIPTIEKLGGGSVRCMMAEIFLPRA